MPRLIGKCARGNALPWPGQPFTCTSDLTAAAASLATAVTRARIATLLEGRWENYVWFRVQGADVLEDICVAFPDRNEPSIEEAAWLAATTSR